MENIKARAKRLKDSFNLTIEQWEIINQYQNGKCFLCGKSQKSGKRLATDHRHATGLVSGLLDSQCNRLLGKIEGLGWTVETLRRLIEYLTDPPAVRALGREVIGFAGRVNTKRHRAWIRKQAKITRLVGG